MPSHELNEPAWLEELQQAELDAYEGAPDADEAADAVRHLPTAGSPNPRETRLSHFPGAGFEPF